MYYLGTEIQCEGKNNKQSGSYLLHLSTNRIHPIRNVKLGESCLKGLTLQPKAREIWTD